MATPSRYPADLAPEPHCTSTAMGVLLSFRDANLERRFLALVASKGARSTAIITSFLCLVTLASPLIASIVGVPSEVLALFWTAWALRLLVALAAVLQVVRGGASSHAHAEADAVAREEPVAAARAAAAEAGAALPQLSRRLTWPRHALSSWWPIVAAGLVTAFLVCDLVGAWRCSVAIADGRVNHVFANCGKTSDASFLTLAPIVIWPAVLLFVIGAPWWAVLLQSLPLLALAAVILFVPPGAPAALSAGPTIAYIAAADFALIAAGRIKELTDREAFATRIRLASSQASAAAMREQRSRALELRALEQHRHELAEAASRASVEAGIDASSKALAFAAHELRGPLLCILASVDLFSAHGELQTLSRDARADLAELRASAKGLRRLADEILDMSRLRAGAGIEVRPTERVDVRALLLDAVHQTCAFACVPLVLQVAPSVGRAIMTDGTRLRQCVMNALTNSAKHTLRGCILVCVDLVEGSVAEAEAEAEEDASTRAAAEALAQTAAEDASRSASGANGAVSAALASAEATAAAAANAEAAAAVAAAAQAGGAGDGSLTPQSLRSLHSTPSTPSIRSTQSQPVRPLRRYVLCVEVVDTGTGLGDADPESLFAEYAHAPTAVLARVLGTGLGLSIVRKIAKALKGTCTLCEAERPVPRVFEGAVIVPSAVGDGRRELVLTHDALELIAAAEAEAGAGAEGGAEGGVEVERGADAVALSPPAGQVHSEAQQAAPATASASAGAGAGAGTGEEEGVARVAVRPLAQPASAPPAASHAPPRPPRSVSAPRSPASGPGAGSGPGPTSLTAAVAAIRATVAPAHVLPTGPFIATRDGTLVGDSRMVLPLELGHLMLLADPRAAAREHALPAVAVSRRCTVLRLELPVLELGPPPVDLSAADALEQLLQAGEGMPEGRAEALALAQDQALTRVSPGPEVRPAEPAPATAEAKAATPPMSATIATVLMPRSRLRALVVDDSETARRLIVRLCQRVGWDADSVASGEECLLRMTQGAPEALRVASAARYAPSEGVERIISAASSLPAPQGSAAISNASAKREMLAVLRARSDAWSATLPFLSSLSGREFLAKRAGAPPKVEPGAIEAVAEAAAAAAPRPSARAPAAAAAASLAGARPRDSYWPYDCLLVDIGLVGLPGDAVCRRLRNLGCLVPLVAVTGQAGWLVESALLASGFDLVLSKPFGLAELRMALERARDLALHRPGMGPGGRVLLRGRGGPVVASGPGDFDGGSEGGPNGSVT